MSELKMLRKALMEKKNSLLEERSGRLSVFLISARLQFSLLLNLMPLISFRALF